MLLPDIVSAGKGGFNVAEFRGGSFFGVSLSIFQDFPNVGQLNLSRQKLRLVADVWIAEQLLDQYRPEPHIRRIQPQTATDWHNTQAHSASQYQ